MRILIDINHPAHVHFFKNAIWEWKHMGHEILIAARDKEITIDLLKEYGFSYEVASVQRKGLINLLFELLIRDINLIKLGRRFNPDLYIGLGSPSSAHAARILGKKSITFTDTEHSIEQYYLYAPFTHYICTPSCFERKINKKQVKYDGYHELAYLHPKRFKPNPQVLKEVGFTHNTKFFIVRFVSWSASHDYGRKGFTVAGKEKIVYELEKYGKIIISSESKLPPNLEKYKMNISSSKIHDLLFFATMYIGEGGTMASEAAVLGTPSIYMNPLKLGYLNELMNRYGLLYSFEDENLAFEKMLGLLKKPNLKKEWQIKRNVMLKEKIDVTQWMVDFIDKQII